jgi:hypothetical protein
MNGHEHALTARRGRRRCRTGSQPIGHAAMPLLLLLLGLLWLATATAATSVEPAASDDISFAVDMASFLARHDLAWDFRWTEGDPHIPCVSRH